MRQVSLIAAAIAAATALSSKQGQEYVNRNLQPLFLPAYATEHDEDAYDERDVRTSRVRKISSDYKKIRLFIMHSLAFFLAGISTVSAFIPAAQHLTCINLRGAVQRRDADASCLRMVLPKSVGPAKLVAAGSAEATQLESILANCGLWSVPPTMMTMHLDKPESFVIVKGLVEILACTVQGVPLGESVTFQTGDYGIVPGGSYRWTILKQTTKKSKLDPSEPIGLLGIKGWREEPPIKALQGIGTLSTQGLTSEDDMIYLKKLVADKGFIPKRAWEEAIQNKLDRDIYLANVNFVVTDKGIIVRDRVKDFPLAVLTENSWEDFNENVDYVETEGSKRWRKDGNFAPSPFFANKENTSF